MLLSVWALVGLWFVLFPLFQPRLASAEAPDELLHSISGESQILTM